jgi:hypothetical protein
VGVEREGGGGGGKISMRCRRGVVGGVGSSFVFSLKS